MEQQVLLLLVVLPVLFCPFPVVFGPTPNSDAPPPPPQQPCEYSRLAAGGGWWVVGGGCDPVIPGANRCSPVFHGAPR